MVQSLLVTFPYQFDYIRQNTESFFPFLALNRIFLPILLDSYSLVQLQLNKILLGRVLIKNTVYIHQMNFEN